MSRRYSRVVRPPARRAAPFTHRGGRSCGRNNRRLLKGFGSLTDDCIAMTPKPKRYVTRAGLKTRLVLGLILLVVGLSLLQTWNNDRTTGSVAPLFVMAITACVGGVWNLLGALRAGLWIDPRGITVRGTLRTRRLVWGDIASFDMEASAGFGGKCLRVRSTRSCNQGSDRTTTLRSSRNSTMLLRAQRCLYAPTLRKFRTEERGS